jgi:hypothetical protein
MIMTTAKTANDEKKVAKPKAGNELVADKPQTAQMPSIQERYFTMLQTAVTGGADITVIEKVIKLHEEFDKKESRKEFFRALSKFQSEVPIIRKKHEVNFEHKMGGGSTQYKYAKLEDIAEAIAPHLVTNGLSYRFEQSVENGSIQVTCIITHAGGHEERSTMYGFPDASGKKNPAQQIASTNTYLRRYTITGSLGLIIAEEDDDGNGGEVSWGNVGIASDQNQGQYQQASEQAQPQEQPINQGDFCTDQHFDECFPAWEKKIKSGKKTAQTLWTFLNGHGVKLTDSQYRKLFSVQGATE